LLRSVPYGDVRRQGTEDGLMAKVEVRLVPQGRGYRLELYHEDAHIGEYEQSWASEESGDLAAKVKEAEGASDLLLDAHRRHGGKIAVRWNGKTRQKEIRTYQENQADPGRGGTVLALIPRPYWRKP
jgi:hypothetical protein